ncbi:MAG: glycosyltransferase family 2 protein [Pseudomonadota bacterium]
MIENVFIVMPAYNAGGTVEGVFARIPPQVRARLKRCLVVDDGSTDDTAEALARLAERLPGLTVLRHEVNRGYGAAEKTVLNQALRDGVEVAVLLHADGQYSPEKIPELLEPFDRDEADLVQGSRMLGGGALKGGMPFYKYAANKCLTAIENLAFGLGLAEYHSGFMLYSRRTLETIAFNRLSESFDFDLEMIVAAKIFGLRIKEIAIPTIYGDEISYLHPVKYGLDVLKVVARYRRGYYHRLLGAAG